MEINQESYQLFSSQDTDAHVHIVKNLTGRP